MSQKNKITHIASSFFLTILLCYFVASSSIALIHSFTHLNNQAAPTQLVSHDSFLGKLIFSHSKTKAPKFSDDCLLFSFSNFQNQISVPASLAFFMAMFYLVFFSRIFDRVKAAHLLSSKSSRAPPQIS